MQSIQMSAKDVVIFASKANHSVPSKYDPPAPLPNEQKRGVMLPDGSINWMCPCLGGLPYGPCGFEFREFFSCLPQFNDNNEGQEQDESAKAKECFPKFAAMKKCFSQFPKLYPPDEDDETLGGGPPPSSVASPISADEMTALDKDHEKNNKEGNKTDTSA